MNIDAKELQKIQTLVGKINESNLKYVDCYISDFLGIFIPSVGFCEYAITPQHTHPAYSFVLFFSKEQSIVQAEIEIRSNHYLMTAISPNMHHEETATDTFTRYMAIFISKEFYEIQYAIYSNREPEHYIWKQFLVNHDIMFYLKEFMYEYENRLPGCENMLKGLGTVITHQLIRSLLKINTSKSLISDKFEIEKIIEYMHQHFGEKLSVGILAKLINMSESHFIRIFKKEIELTPMEYLIKLRIEKAKKLLMSNTKSITEIAFLCGFNSTSHFSSCFAKQLGMTPSAYHNLYAK